MPAQAGGPTRMVEALLAVAYTRTRLGLAARVAPVTDPVLVSPGRIQILVDLVPISVDQVPISEPRVPISVIQVPVMEPAEAVKVPGI